MKFSFLFYEPIRELDELDRRMGLLATMGYEGVELSASHPFPYTAEAVASLVEKHRLPVVSFLTGWSYPHEGLCLTSPDATIRDRAVHRLVEYVEQAAKLKALSVVGLMQGLRSDEPDDETAKGRIADGLRRIAHQAEKVGGSVVIEPVNHLQVGFNNRVDEAVALAECVGSPALGVMLDTFHMHIEERSVVEATRLHAARARHVHLCETTGGPFGSGALDFRGVLSALDESGYDRVVSIKVYRQLGWEEAARSSARFLRRLGFGNFQGPAS